jgi:hypothetical protein
MNIFRQHIPVILSLFTALFFVVTASIASTSSRSLNTATVMLLKHNQSIQQSIQSSVPETDNFKYIDNGIVKLGIDLTRGGSIGFFGPSNTNTNLVNCHDMGREIQLSFYSGPAFYNPDGKCDKLFMNQEWPWNPIGAGDIKGNHGTINSWGINKTYAHVSTTPLQWACDDVPCECEFEQTITLGGPANTGAKIDAVLHNHRSDVTSYPPREQELPAVYSNGGFYRLMTAQSGKVVELNAGFDPSKPFPWVPGQFQADENWAALVNKDGFGMGVVNFDTTSFIGGFSGKKGSGGPYDPQTGYIAPVKSVTLPNHGTYEYTFYLVLGDVNTIRSYANQVRPARK